MTSVVWIGRVSRPGELAQRTVRIVTDGRVPTGDDIAEEIGDPFALALPATGGDAHGDPWRLAHDLPAKPAGVRAPIGELVLRPPVRPGKIVCVGRNYAAHAKEMGNEIPTEPLLFTKPASSLLAAGEPLVLPRGFERIDMEAELVVVIGRSGRAFDRDHALDHVAGYTLGNDVSCRDYQKLDKQWTRAKGFDGFAPIGPWIRMHPPGDALPPELRVQGFIDDELRQDAPLSAMIFDIAHVLTYIAACMTLEPGDLVFTGTPEGVSALSPELSTQVGLAPQVEIVPPPMPIHGFDGFALGRLTTPVR